MFSLYLLFSVFFSFVSWQCFYFSILIFNVFFSLSTFQRLLFYVYFQCSINLWVFFNGKFPRLTLQNQVINVNFSLFTFYFFLFNVIFNVYVLCLFVYIYFSVFSFKLSFTMFTFHCWSSVFHVYFSMFAFKCLLFYVSFSMFYFQCFILVFNACRNFSLKILIHHILRVFKYQRYFNRSACLSSFCPRKTNKK